MLEWENDLKLCGTGLYLDSRQPRGACFVSHAHSDHLGSHQHAIATGPTRALAEYRIGLRGVTELAYGVDHAFCPETTLRLLPAGHVFGSAMLHVTRPEGTLLYTGDFKLRECLTVQRAQPCEADVLVMESTFGQPFFRFPPWRAVVDELLDRVGAAMRAGRQPIVMGYTLGKAQEITRIFTDAGVPVTVHGAVFHLNRIHEEHGVALGPYRRYNANDFHGPRALALEERGVLVAPPNVARTGFVTRFDNPLRVVLTGWGMLKNAPYRYGVDHVLPLSDHADFDELLELVERVNPKKIYSHHGYREFADILRARGHDAELARPDEQLRLFG
jgi:Cft2 family RNA processing exonuclease